MVIRKYLFPVMVIHTTRESRDKNTKPYLASYLAICSLLLHPLNKLPFPNT